MHLHILGICGTFMGGVAVLAREAGHRVSGSDENVFPPMSTQLEKLGITLHGDYGAQALSPEPDIVVVGNVMSRGRPVVEHVLDSGVPYTSGPEWLANHVLADRHVLAVAGTHGKTTTSSMLAWILDCAGHDPGFLIGGMPVDFGVSARLGSSPYFVVEADEYDTAFFDKRSKFVHYRPRTLIMTNLEYDHADIFPDMESIRRQFHHLVRTVPGSGMIVAHQDSHELDRVIEMGCWTSVERYGSANADWKVSGDDEQITVQHAKCSSTGPFAWPGEHYRLNALAACAAANAVGVSLEMSIAALGKWCGVRRRLEQVGRVRNITVYDDFAHHPTEIAATLQALRARIGTQRLLAVLEPRSNSMKMGVHSAALAASFAGADQVFVYSGPEIDWDIEATLAAASMPVQVIRDHNALLDAIVANARPHDHIVVMSNGAFDGMPRRITGAL